MEKLKRVGYQLFFGNLKGKWVRESFACGSATLVSPDTPANLTPFFSYNSSCYFQFSIFNPPLSIFLSLKRGSHVYSSIFIDNLLRAHQDLKRPMGVFLRVAYLVSSVKWKLEKGDTHLIDLTRAGKIMVGSGQEN